MVYDYIGSFGEGLFLVMKGDSIWCVDKTGKKKFDFKYQQKQTFAESKAAVRKNGKWGYINTAGKEIIAPKYDQLSGTFSEGFANVQLAGKWGFIDAQGKTAVPFIYNVAYGGFKGGLAKVKEKDGWSVPWFYVSKTGIEYREK